MMDNSVNEKVEFYSLFVSENVFFGEQNFQTKKKQLKGMERLQKFNNYQI